MPRLLLVLVSKPTTGSNFKVKTYCANDCRSVALIRESQIPLKPLVNDRVTFRCFPVHQQTMALGTPRQLVYSLVKFAEHPKAHPFGPNLSFQWFCSRSWYGRSIQYPMSIRQAFTMERWEEKLPTCHLAGVRKRSRLMLRLKGAKHQMNSNDLRGGIEPLASFCNSVI